MAGITEGLVNKFIEKKIEEERPKFLVHVEEFVKDGTMKKELLEELGDLMTQKFSELEEEISQLKEKLEIVKPDEGWLQW
jgi:hypothetical protein